MPHDVFVSYASQDKTVADAVCNTLESAGVRCWIAPRDVVPGMEYGEAIIDAINDCRIMVLVFSSKANVSNHISREIERAVSKGVTVMPLRIEQVMPSKTLDYFIGSVHWLDAVTPPLEAHLKLLAANCKTILAREPRVPPIHPQDVHAGPSSHPSGLPTNTQILPDHTRGSRPAWTYAVIGSLLIVILVLGYIVFKSPFFSRPAPQETVATIPPPPQPGAPSTVTPSASQGKPASGAAAATKPSVSTPPSTAPAVVPPVATATPAKKTPVPATQPPKFEKVLSYVPGSSVKLEQLIGDLDKEKHQPTLSQTFSRFGLEGANMGSSFEHQGHAYFLFGDAVGRGGHAQDSIASTDATDPGAGVRLDFLMDRRKFLAIEPPGISMNVMEVPVAGISLGGQMYIVVSTNNSPDRPQNRSVLVKFTPPAQFDPIRTISQLPGGRFVRMSMHVTPGAIAGLPPGGPFILIWGTGEFRKSDAYLSIVPVAQLESGKGTRYFAGLNAAGAPIWSEREADSRPIVENGALGDLSVSWCKDLGLWLMTYDRRSPSFGIAFSYSRNPWGPWSEAQILFNGNRDGAFGKFIHNPQLKPDDGLAGPVFGVRNQANPGALIGGAFMPYMVERWTKLQGSELSVYYTLSTVNPYVVVLMKSRLQIQ
jgi:hypothetical protein